MKIKLTDKEKSLCEGADGEVMQKVMLTVARYGEALGADELVPITAPGHLVIPYALPGIGPSIEMLEELVEAGLKTTFPFTLDPRSPLDFHNWFLEEHQIKTLREMYRSQQRYDELMLQLGARDSDAYTCRPYLEEVGNIPQRGDILAWSESACAVFANAVLGARTNRNGAIIDLLCNIAGKVPRSGFLLDSQRQASWVVEVITSRLPDPKLLGALIGSRVLDGVPYIRGISTYLDPLLSPFTRDYLHELGAASATAGAVGLFHVEGITPEAVELGEEIIAAERSFIVDDEQIEALKGSFPILWKEKEAVPEKCYLGCPHLSSEQIDWWAVHIRDALLRRGQSKLRVSTTISAAPQTLLKIENDTSSSWKVLKNAGVKFSDGCPMQLFDNNLAENSRIITNSNKLRTYTNARFFTDNEIIEIIASGAL